MERLQHFSHEHVLSLVQLQPYHNNEHSDDDDEEKYAFVVETHHVGKCKMCQEEIYSFHLCYYSCKDCDYSLHKFCAQLPATQQNHALHPGHNLTLSIRYQLYDSDYMSAPVVDKLWDCDICNSVRNMFYNYHCSICKFTMDITCATMSEQKMKHPSHPHQLQRCFSKMESACYACGLPHNGTFYHCATCSWFMIHLDCALLPMKLLIQRPTIETFTHPHLLTLAYSFPYIEKKAKFFPSCRVCDIGFKTSKWHYRCNKCQYYVHSYCATTGPSATTWIRKHYKTFEDDYYPDLINYPSTDESFNLLKYQLIKKDEVILKGKIDGGIFGHEHPLILFDTLLKGSVSLHDPMKRVELLCDGCVRPITDVPFYKCSQHHCGFVLHEWCTRLPSVIQGHREYEAHELRFLVKPTSLSVFWCKICRLPCNGFAYGCMQCEYYVDINCGLIPDLIKHDAHPDHPLLRFKASLQQSVEICKACKCMMEERLGFRCLPCRFFLHTECALSLPRTTRHKYDKHPLRLSYFPVENHTNEYFCDICESEFNPAKWFYHCSTCDSSMHTACAPVKLQCEQSALSNISVYSNVSPIFYYLNVKFGVTLEITGHEHPVTLVQGINVDGKCIVCDQLLQHHMILKCVRCKFSLHVQCAGKLSSNPAIHNA